MVNVEHLNDNVEAVFTHKRQKAAMPKARLPVQASDRRERDKQVVASLG
jgi:hypothetical protein